ncbi:B12-binding domain-containing radical SAM protein [bacterium]|nr:MAG: B12-binding domain-containing radical SAM protein [bacterium]
MSTKVLLVYPEMPVTYWSFRYTLPFIGKKASIPPIGLLTVAAMLPKDFEVKLIDMNTSKLTDKDILTADIVFTSTMLVQKRSHEKVVEMCNRLHRPIVAGGPYPTSSYEQISGVDYFVLNEAEVTLPQFLNDYKSGRAKHIYADETKPDITRTPAPRFDLLDTKQYAIMALQYSRGCPFSCEFCDIVSMFGHIPRTKTPDQFVEEMDGLYRSGYRGSLFIVDDNFIGNKKNVKELLPAISEWQKKCGFPFTLFTEASVNLAEDSELMDMMVAAGFNMVFLGIETPVKESLVETHKMQNIKSDLLKSIHTIQKKGMEVTGGFIIGFDNDPEDIFERQIHFIQQSGIPAAMVGLLTALPNTQLYKRLKTENRLVDLFTSGNNTHDLRLNFVPKMNMNKLVDGYRQVLSEIYKPGKYFHRCFTLLKKLRSHRGAKRRIRLPELRALIMSLTCQTFSFYGLHYIRFISKVLLTRPASFQLAITLAVKGHHFMKITRETLAVANLGVYKEKLLDVFRQMVKEKFDNISAIDLKEIMEIVGTYRDQSIADLKWEFDRIHRDFQPYAEEVLQNFEQMMDEILVELSANNLQPIRLHS